jgi:hypothetical protein
VPDGAGDHLKVAEAPLLEVVLDVDKLFAGLVDAPVVGGCGIDLGEHVDQPLVQQVRLGEVAVEQVGGDGVAAPAQEAQELVVEAGLVKQALEQAAGVWVVVEDLHHLGVLVSEQELDRAVLPGLEARAGGEEGADLCVLARRQGRQHRPLLDEGLLDVLDPGQALQGRSRFIGRE